MRYFFLVLCVSGLAGVSHYVYAQTEDVGDVEVVIEGKHYPSIHAYRRDQIKNALMAALSVKNFREFSNEELCAIIAEVRSLRTGDKQLLQKPKTEPLGNPAELNNQFVDKTDARDSDSIQMQEMLNKYLDEHKDAEPIDLNPDKIKNILIEEKNPPGEHPSE